LKSGPDANFSSECLLRSSPMLQELTTKQVRMSEISLDFMVL